MSSYIINRFSHTLNLDLDYFIRGGLWLFFSTLASTIGGIFLSSLFANLWPKDVYGQFAFLTSALSFITALTLPGIGQIVVQSVAEGKEGIYKKAIQILHIWALPGTVILLFGFLFFYLRQNPILATAVLVSALAFPLTVGNSLYNYYLTGKKDFRKVALFNVISQFISIGFTAFALWKIPSLVWVAFFSAWSTALVNFFLTRHILSQLKNDKSDKQNLRFGLHLSASQILILGADYFDRIFIPILLGFTNNAIYAFALLIPLQLNNFFKIFTTLSQPKIAEISKKNLSKSLVKKSLQLGIIIFIIVVLYIITAPLIFDIFFTQYKESSVYLSQIFSLSLLLFPSNIVGLSFVKERAAKELYILNASYLMLSVITLIILVPLLGLLGAVIAKVFTKVLFFLVQLYLFNKTNF